MFEELNILQVFIVMFLIIAIAFGVGYAVVLTDPSDFTEANTWTIIGGMAFYPFFQVATPIMLASNTYNVT